MGREMTARDITGRRFGKLLILRRAPDSPNRIGFSRWFAKCDCGNETNVSREALTRRSGAKPATSCGCNRVATFGDKRRCSKCRMVRPLDEFNVTGRRISKGDDRQSRCIACASAVKKTAYAASPLRARERAALAHNGKRRRVLNHYGWECACCGDDTEQALSIDHIASDGNQHRKAVGRDLYGWLIRNGMPDGYQTLCQTCNWAKHVNKGYCPHVDEKLVAALSFGS